MLKESKGIVAAAERVWQRGCDCLGEERPRIKFGVLENPFGCVAVSDLVPETACSLRGRTAIAEATSRLWKNAENKKKKVRTFVGGECARSKATSSEGAFSVFQLRRRFLRH